MKFELFFSFSKSTRTRTFNSSKMKIDEQKKTRVSKVRQVSFALSAMTRGEEEEEKYNMV